ncbi:unnamed protein product [Victoria cruziana]
MAYQERVSPYPPPGYPQGAYPSAPPACEECLHGYPAGPPLPPPPPPGYQQGYQGYFSQGYPPPAPPYPPQNYYYQYQRQSGYTSFLEGW